MKTVQEWEKEFGLQIRDLRLRRNLGQVELARRAGTALNVVKNLEAGKGSTMSSLIKLLRVLGNAEWLLSLAPEISISPLQMISVKPSRKRATREKSLDV